MPRAKSGPATRQRRKKILKQAEGYYGSKSTLYRTAKQQVMKSLQYAYRDRKRKKRDFRKLWITRINAACRQEGISYSRFMNGLKLAGVEVNRKVLADLAVNDPNGFAELVNVSKAALVNGKAETVKVEEQVGALAAKPSAKKETEKASEAKEEKPLEKKAEAKTVDVKEEATADVKEDVKETADATKRYTEEELSKLTVAKLRELAKEHEISIPSSYRKAEIVKYLYEQLNQ